MGFLVFILILGVFVWVISYPFRKYSEIKEKKRKEDKIEKAKDSKNDQEELGINTNPKKYPVYSESKVKLDEESFVKMEEIGTGVKEGKEEVNLYRGMEREFNKSNIFHGCVKFYPEGKPEFRNLSQVHEKLEQEKREFAYLPDISYIDEKKGIAIDIEVDEPYVNEDGDREPIHYIYDDVSGEGITSTDERRNIRFNGKGWDVIRFSEKQARDYSKECCEYIKRVISYIEKDRSKLLDVRRNRLVPLDDRWTTKQAVKKDR